MLDGSSRCKNLRNIIHHNGFYLTPQSTLDPSAPRPYPARSKSFIALHAINSKHFTRNHHHSSNISLNAPRTKRLLLTRPFNQQTTKTKNVSCVRTLVCDSPIVVMVNGDNKFCWFWINLVGRVTRTIQHVVEFRAFSNSCDFFCINIRTCSFSSFKQFWYVSTHCMTISLISVLCSFCNYFRAKILTVYEFDCRNWISVCFAFERFCWESCKLAKWWCRFASVRWQVISHWPWTLICRY